MSFINSSNFKIRNKNQLIYLLFMPLNSSNDSVSIFYGISIDTICKQVREKKNKNQKEKWFEVKQA